MRTAKCLLAIAGALLVAKAYAAMPQNSLPDGPGKELLHKHCAKCHEQQWIEQAEGSEAAWVTKIRRMIRRGSDLPPSEVSELAKYLAQALPPRVREQTLAQSPVTLTVSDAGIRPVQTWIRTAGMLKPNSNDLLVNLSSEYAALVKAGQRVRAFRIESRSSMYQGQVIIVNANTAIIRLKSKSSDGDRYLVEIVVDRGDYLSIPNEAIIEESDRQVVYVQRRTGDYVPREIRSGIKGELFVQVMSGLMEGERVVTFGSFFIDAAFKMKSSMESTSGDEPLRIEYRGKPNPPREGGNEVEVTVKKADSSPLTDGAVTLTYYMAAMPSMNMPEMRSEFPLEHQGSGKYTGQTYFSMGGAWLVTVTVSQNGQQLDEKEFSVIAK